ncbi:hypothetical protein [Streptomyces sp. DSM 40750]|nr:hypothetical protein [Streptomyces sp. DSM 40750]UUU25936.1 hypothetical protein JIX55_40090 [Streptomyces sp. DSM 40750]
MPEPPCHGHHGLSRLSLSGSRARARDLAHQEEVDSLLRQIGWRRVPADG